MMVKNGAGSASADLSLEEVRGADLRLGERHTPLVSGPASGLAQLGA
jgi:hypothetical protein